MILRDTSFEQIAFFESFNRLEIKHHLNSFSDHVLSLSGYDERISLFGLDCLVEVRRKIPNESWYTEYIGFHRSSERSISEADRRIYTSYGRGLLDLVNRRSIMYYATTTYTLKSGPGETVMKEYVEENLGASATSPPRVVSGTFPNFTIELDLARGNNWFGQRSYKNLLEVLQEVAIATSVDFDIVWTGTGFEFKCYSPQRGTDRRDTVIFSPSFGNMIRPNYILSRTEEANVIVVMGSDIGTARRIQVRESTAQNDSPWNKIEAAHDARQEDTISALQSAGDAQLEELAAKENFTCEIVQTNTLQYGRDYFLGDIVTLVFDDIIRVKKIIGVEINISEGKEDINLEFGDIP